MDRAGEAGKRRRRFFAARLGIEEAHEGDTVGLQTEDRFRDALSEAAIDEVNMAQRLQQVSGPSTDSTVGFPCDECPNQHEAPLQALTWNATFLAEVSTPSKSASAQCTGSIQHCSVDSGMNDESLKWFSGKDVKESYTGDRGDSVGQVHGVREEGLQWSDGRDSVSSPPLTEVGFPCTGPQEKEPPLGMCNSQGHQLEGLDSIAIGDPFWSTVLGDLELGTFSVKDMGHKATIPQASQENATGTPTVCELEQPSPGHNLDNLDRPNEALQAQGLQMLAPQGQVMGVQPPYPNWEDSEGQTSEPSAPAPPPSSSGGLSPCVSLSSHQEVISRGETTHNLQSSSTKECHSRHAQGQPSTAAASTTAPLLQKQRVTCGKAPSSILEIPGTSWILLGGHMWEQGVIPDIGSLPALDDPTQEHPATVPWRQAESSCDKKRRDDALVTHPAGKGMPPVCHAWVLSEPLAATIASLQDRERKRRLVGEGFPLPAAPGNALSWLTPSQFARGGGEIRVAPGIQGPGIQGPVLGREERAGSGSMDGASMMDVPRLLGEGGGGCKNVVLGRLMQAASALDSGNKAQFLSLCALVRPHANRLGTASQRVAHMLLNMLTLRAEGKGVDFLKKPVRCTINEAEKCLLWQFSALPLALFSFTSILCEIMPMLVGKSRVHIVSIGDNLLPFLPILIRLLVNHSSSGKRTRLRKLRVTTVSYFKLVWRYGKNTTSLRDPSRAARMLGTVAAEAGVKFEFEGIEVEDDNMALLRTVKRRRDDSLAVMFSDSLKFAADNVGLGALTETMKCIVSLQPEVIAVAEMDLDGSQQDFLPRFMHVSLLLWEHFHMHDVVASEKCKPLVHLAEQVIWAHAVCNVLACEGTDRRACPRSSRGWQEHFESWGFEQRAVSYSTLYAARNVVRAFPEGFAVERTGKHLSLLWTGVSLQFSASFVQQMQETF